MNDYDWIEFFLIHARTVVARYPSPTVRGKEINKLKQ